MKRARFSYICLVNSLYIIHLDLFYKILLKNEEFILFWKLYMVILLNTEIHATNS